MLFRPKFCCECGERIERSEWPVWKSRRFCDFCATNYPLQEIASKGVVAVAALVMVVGAVNYFAGGSVKKELVMTRASERVPAQTQLAASAAPIAMPTEQKPVAPVAAPAETQPRTLASLAPPVAPRVAPTASEAVYFCGAETKKGTPCSRKVKGNVRCWQHAGMPAMLPPDKLLVSR